MTHSPQPSTGGSSPLPPEGCICGALWTVRRQHGKKDCPFKATPTATGGELESDLWHILATHELPNPASKLRIATTSLEQSIQTRVLKQYILARDRRIALEAQLEEVGTMPHEHGCALYNQQTFCNCYKQKRLAEIDRQLNGGGEG